MNWRPRFKTGDHSTAFNLTKQPVARRSNQEAMNFPVWLFKLTKLAHLSHDRHGGNTIGYDFKNSF